MQGYDAWVTRDPRTEYSDDETVPYFTDGQWYRLPNGAVRWRWPCEFCNSLRDCLTGCYSAEYDDTYAVQPEVPPGLTFQETLELEREEYDRDPPPLEDDDG